MSTVSTDPIADMLTRVRNAISVNKHQVILPYSKVKEQIALNLKKAGFIDDVSMLETGAFKELCIIINGEGKNARITEIKRISTPGRRIYKGSSELPTIRRGRGVIIVSTSKGVMLGHEAKKHGLGGEVMCSVY